MRSSTFTQFAIRSSCEPRERDFLIDNLLVRIHLIIELSSVDRHCAMEVPIPIFQIASYLRANIKQFRTF